MPPFAPALQLDSTMLEAIERAARDEGVSTEAWLTGLIAADLRAKGYLPDLDSDGLRPDELTSSNDG